MDGGDGITVEVAYARPGCQRVVELQVPRGTTARQAVLCSRVLEAFPEIDPEAYRLGVFGRRVGPDHVLAQDDRVEIYRPLLVDPREIRRLRARRSAPGRGGAA